MAHRVGLAETAAAERATGYVVGGIRPLGTRWPLRAVVEEAVLGLGVVHGKRAAGLGQEVSAGKRGLQAALAPVVLVRPAGAIVASLGIVTRAG